MIKESEQFLQCYSSLFSERVRKNLPMNYYDFKYNVLVGEEFSFTYDGKDYEIVWNYQLEFYEIQKGCDAKLLQKFSSAEDFLENARIKNKTLEEIFDENERKTDSLF